MAEKERGKVSGERIAIFGLLIALTFTLTGFAIASAVVSNSNGSVNGCYSPKNGKFRVNIAGCKAGKETAITLGGPPKSYYADNGSTSISGFQDVVVQSVAVPAGTYAVSFSTTTRKSDSDSERGVGCYLATSGGGSLPDGEQDLHYPLQQREFSLTVNGRLSLASAGTIQAHCEAFGNTGASLSFFHGTMTAISSS